MKLVVLGLLLALTARLAVAQVGPTTTCDAAAVEVEKQSLDRERSAARTWNTAWAITYAGLAGVQVGAALLELSPGKEFDDAARASLYIGAGKAVIGSLSRLVIPLRVPQVTMTGDACADGPALAAARRYAYRKERNTFWLQLGGGAALHVLGGGYLVVYEDAWRDALISLGLGVVISSITLYTEPRNAWRHPPRTVAVAPMPTQGGGGLSLVGTF